METQFIVLMGLFLILLLAGIVLLKINNQDVFVSKRIMTKNEEEFFSRMIEALPEYYVFPQVAIRAFVKPSASSTDKKRYSRQLGRIGSKHSDFLVCDRSLNIVAIVELDDKTHIAEKDAARDEMTGSAGYTTIRYESKIRPTVAEIRDDIVRLSNDSRKGRMTHE